MTIKEIARQAGVAASTVSLVLNDKPGVHPQTRARVAALLTENGYEIRKNNPQPLEHGEIKFVRYRAAGHKSERNEDFYVGLLNGAERSARHAGFSLSISNLDGARLPEMLTQLAAQKNLTGVILLASEMDAAQLGLLDGFPLPLVVIDSPFQHISLNSVSMDNLSGAFQAVRHLYGLGHRRIGFLRGAVELGGLHCRYLGYQRAMSDLGLLVSPDWVIDIDLLFDQATEQMLRYLSGRRDLPTAFFAGNDIIAAGCVRAFLQAGYRVPEDVSVVGFDDGVMSTFVTPQLTTLRVGRRRMGEMAVERLLAVHRGDRAIVKSTLGVRLIERASTAPPP